MHVVCTVILSLLFLLGGPLGLGAQDITPTAYTLTILGRAAVAPGFGRGGGVGSLTLAGIDDDGTVACTITGATRSQAALCAPTMLLLGDLDPDTTTAALGISAGEVVGYGLVGDFNHAFRFTTATGLQDINQGALLSVALGVRDDVRVGFCVLQGSPGMQPCVFEAGQLLLLPTLGGAQGHLRAAGASGMVGGSTQVADGDFHATLYENSTANPEDLNPPNALGSEVQDINAHGIVVLNSGIRAFRWTRTAGLSELPRLPGAIVSRVEAINDHAPSHVIAVGQQRAPSVAVRWVGDGPAEELSPLVTEPGWSLYQAVDVNNRGEILAYGTKDGLDYAVLLTPVPPAPVRAPEPPPSRGRGPRRR